MHLPLYIVRDARLSSLIKEVGDSSQSQGLIIFPRSQAFLSLCFALVTASLSLGATKRPLRL